MALIPSTMVPLGTPAPDFRLPDTDGRLVSLSDFAQSPVLVVAFLCNHCPYVKHIRHSFAQLARDYQPQGVAVVAINSNDPVFYPEDSKEKMAEEKQTAGYCFPYLFDETQAVAQAYQAACTPDFFVYDQHRCLIYRGQMDASRPGNGKPNNGGDLRAALDAALAGQPVRREQIPSMGCNIKWKPGREPAYNSR